MFEVTLTASPGQIVVCGVEINANGITSAFSVIVMVDDVTVATVAHASLEVNDTAI